LFEAKKRFGLVVLDYMVTSNHIHLLVYDNGQPNVISRSLQLIAGRVAQEYNLRKFRKGAFWEDRYHATAVSSDKHLWRCIGYIDLNMVRAGVVSHPEEWKISGYHEIQNPKLRYRVIDYSKMLKLMNLSSLENLQTWHRQWIESFMEEGGLDYDEKWSRSIAVGNRKFIDEVSQKLGNKVRKRKFTETRGGYILRDNSIPYKAHFGGEKTVLRPKNGR
jgi:putative transposase